MIGAVLVTVLLNGVAVPSSRPAELIDGSVMVPVNPFVRRIAQRTIYDPLNGTIAISAASGSTTVAITGEPDEAYVPLARIVRALGGVVSYDGRTRVAAVLLAADPPLASAPPYDPSQPTVAPRRLFTPEPTAAPRPVLTGVPKPRRTPIPEPGGP